MKIFILLFKVPQSFFDEILRAIDKEGCRNNILFKRWIWVIKKIIYENLINIYIK